MREYTDKKTNKQKLAAKHYKGLVAPSLDELFIHYNKIVDKIPKPEQYNLFYTLANCNDSADSPRVFLSQDIMPFDIDEISSKDLESRGQDYVKYVCEVLEVLPTDIVIVSSGNGFHFLIRVPTFNSVNYFKENKIFYKAVCARINAKLKSEGLTGKADPTAFEPRRIFRLPGTKNKKPGKPDKECVALSQVLGETKFSLRLASGIENLKAGSHVSPASFQKMRYSIDTKAVLNGCDFLKHCNKNQKTITEPEWKAMISILTHLENGNVLAHSYSKNHPGYSLEETNDKFEQAKVLTGARTCKGINDSVFDCSKCPNFGNVSCPVFIQGENFIATKATGFHTIITNPETGNITKRIPNHEDLKKHFCKSNKAALLGTDIYYYKENYWNKVTKDDVDAKSILKNFAMEKFKPHVDSRVREEFSKEVSDDLRIRKSINDFYKTTENKINLSNGVYDLNSNKLTEHSDKYGFMYKLAYNFQDSPDKPVKFMKFMDDITDGDKEVQKLMFEYAGYMLSGDKCGNQCLFLYGLGGTAKSTFGEVVKSLVPTEIYSSVMVDDFNKENHLSMMQGKLFNISDETGEKAFIQCKEKFKSVVTGADITAKKLYKDVYTFKNKTKLLVTGNKLPYNFDSSNAIYSRLIIIRFDKVFRGTAAENINIVEEMESERPAILKMFLDAYSAITGNKFSVPAKCIAELKEYRDSNDSINVWLTDGWDLAPGHFTNLNEAMSHYEGYCSENHLPVIKLQKSEFSRLVISQYKIETSRKRVNGIRQTGFEGLKLRSAF